MWEISEITTLHNFVHLIKVNQQHMWILLEPQTLLEVIKFHIFQFYDTLGPRTAHFLGQLKQSTN